MSKLNSELALALALDGKLARLDDETASLVAVVDALRALPEPEIDVTFAMALEQRILTEGLENETVTVGRPKLSIVPVHAPEPIAEPRVADNVITMPTRRVRMRKGVAAAAACFMLGAFPIAATASALPGSPFYGLKQNVRSAKIALFGDAMQDATWRLGFAGEHIREAEALVAIGASQKLVGEALDLAAYEFAKANETVKSVDDPDALAKFAEDARATEALLEKSGPILVPEASDAFDRAMKAAQDLTAALSTALGLDFAPAGQVLPTVPGKVAEVLPDGSTVTPSTTQSSTTKVPSGEESAPDGTKTNNPSDNETTTPGGAGKTLKDAGESCSIPGGSQLDELAGGAATTGCTLVVTAI